MAFLQQYWKLQEEYENIYGSNTIVLIEKGSFMECYSTEERGNAKLVSKILNMILTKSNKNLELSDKNPYMVGFPTYRKSKNIPILLSHDLYIVWVEQKDTGGKSFDRAVTKVISPGTYVPDEDSDIDYNFICCINKDYGVCLIDVSIGCVFVRDYKSYEDITRVIDMYKPREVILLDIDFKSDEMMTFKKDEKKYCDIVYQEAVIEKLYNEKENPVLNICKNSISSFICLIDHLHISNPKIMKILELPKLLESMDNLLLHNNLTTQLNLILNSNNKSKGSLLNIIDHTNTPMGKRLLRRRLLNPITDPEKINNRYDEMEKNIKNEMYKKYKETFSGLPDLERIIQRFKLGIITEFEIKAFIRSFERIQSINQNTETIIKQFNENFKVNDTDIEMVDCDQLEKIKRNIDKNTKELNEICNRYELKFESTEKDGYYLSTTARKAESKKKHMKDKYEDVHISKLTSTTSRIMSQSIDTLTHDLTKNSKNYEKLHKEIMESRIQQFVEINFGTITEIITWVSEKDVVSSHCITATKYRYTRPIIKESDKSFVEAKNIRHPIVEHMDVTYVPNDVEFNESKPGMLLYGLNGSGKSCYGKSIALNIILAQMGSFVASETFEYSPYNSIFTRINCDDNMYKAMSSFMVEMTELNSIIQLADKHSIVVGDEMCKGTEDLSATSLVAGAIHWMLEKNIQFIFATHLHKLADISFIKDKVNICHLKTEYVEKIDKIVYNRKLEKGSGDSLYGIEIAKQILRCPEIIYKANETRVELLGDNKSFVNKKKSRYNSKVYVDVCKSCGSNKNLHTHHIIHQCENRTFKHNKNNLMTLCQKCHEDVHTNKLLIESYDVGGKIEHTFTKL